MPDIDLPQINSIPNLPDLKTDVEISRLENLLRANEKLDLLRDRANYLSNRYQQQPRTFYELCMAVKQAEPPKKEESTTFAVGTGVTLGAIATYFVRNVYPARKLMSYVGGMLTGGSMGYAQHAWKHNRAELSHVDERLVAYEGYLNRFEQAMQHNAPPPEITEQWPCTQGQVAQPVMGRG